MGAVCVGWEERLVEAASLTPVQACETAKLTVAGEKEQCLVIERVNGCDREELTL
jgi:hypothetical protein